MTTKQASIPRRQVTPQAPRAAKAGAASRQELVFTKTLRAPLVTLSIDVAPLVRAVSLHVKLTRQQRDALARELAKTLEQASLTMSTDLPEADQRAVQATRGVDDILTTEEAARLVGVSRPFMVKLIEAGDVPLHHKVGNQRRVLRSAVVTWQQTERSRQRKALKRLASNLDDEIFS